MTIHNSYLYFSSVHEPEFSCASKNFNSEYGVYYKTVHDLIQKNCTSFYIYMMSALQETSLQTVPKLRKIVSVYIEFLVQRYDIDVIHAFPTSCCTFVQEKVLALLQLHGLKEKASCHAAKGVAVLLNFPFDSWFLRFFQIKTLH